jgi:hypothetical protein
MRCKALKSKAHSLGWCYWRYNTPHRPFAQPPSFYHFTTSTLSFFSLSISAPHSLCTTTTYFLLLSQHLGWHLTSYLWRIDTRSSSVHFAGNCRYLVSKLLGSTTGIVRVWGHPVYTLLLFQFFFWRVLLALSRTILDRVSFMCFISSADTPSLSIWRLHHTITSIIYIYPCWLKGKG